MSLTQQIELPENLRIWLKDPNTHPKKFTAEGVIFTNLEYHNEGYKSVVLRGQNPHGNKVVLKFATGDDYENKSFMQEYNLASKLESYQEFAKFYAAERHVLKVGDKEHSVVVFVYEYISGKPLRQFLKEEGKSITISWFKAYVRSICSALSALQFQGIRHDDLHDGNVMIVPPPGGALHDQYAVKVIDTGSMKYSTETSKKPRDDHAMLVEHLVKIWNVIHQKVNLSKGDRKYLREIVETLKKMTEEDAAIALRDPKQIAIRFEEVFTKVFRSSSSEDGDVLSNPFDYPSSEYMPNHKLVRIFANSCPWLEKVNTPNPVLLTGPRGCGKSTIFRWLSLRTHLHKENLKDIDKIQIAGFYISCSSDLQNRIGWIETDALASKFRHEIIHYFNLLVLREVVLTMERIAERNDRETYWGFGPAQEQALYDHIKKYFEEGTFSALQGVSKMAQTKDTLEHYMFLTHETILRGRNMPTTLPETFLSDLSTLLATQMPLFARKKICYLIDDYSLHRLPSKVQVILNSIVWERTSNHIFKLSTEKRGAILEGRRGATADMTREIDEVDCGREYITLEDAGKKKDLVLFGTELLDARLDAANYMGRTNTLIGSSKWPEGSLGKALVASRSRKNQYHEMECIAEICSGDVSVLLAIFRKIFELGKVEKNTTSIVSERIQHKAIRKVALAMLDTIKIYVPRGREMYSVTMAFGNLARNILDKGKTNNNSDTPWQVPRIEIDQKQEGVLEGLKPDRKEIAEELVRRAVFIEMDATNARHGNVLAYRWNLRRIYLACFGAAMSKNRAVKRDPKWFDEFLLYPKDACADEWRKYWRKDNDTEDFRQQSMEEILREIEDDNDQD